MDVTVIGDAFVDVIVPIGYIRPGETLHKKIITFCGGTANVAVQVSKLGRKAKFIGKVGNDLFGNYFKQNLKKSRVQDLTFIDNQYPTGLCVSLCYSNGERAMIADRGANDQLKKEEIRNYIKEINSSEIVYFSGYSLLSKQTSKSVLYLINESKKKNCKIYFNPGSPNLIKSNFRDIIRQFVDILILNIDEAKKISRKQKLDAISNVLRDMVEIAVITLGKEGCIVIKEDKYAHIKTRKMDVTDTTGAGDAFAAGFIVGRLNNREVVDCAILGNKSSAYFLEEKRRIIK